MLIGTYDGLTGEQTVREATPEEIAEREEQAAAHQAAEESKAEALAELIAKREALLERLGITEAEAKLLLG